MLQQVCHHSWLNGLLQSTSESSNTNLNIAMSILQTTSDSSIAHSQQDLICLLLDLYGLLLIHVQKQYQPNLWHFKHVPHLPDTQVLLSWVTTKKYLIYQSHQYSIVSSHSKSSTVSYCNSLGGIEYGFIHSIWIHAMENTNNSLSLTLLLISLQVHLTYSDNMLNLYIMFPKLRCSVVYTYNPMVRPISELMIIRLDQLVGHVGYYPRPIGIFGIQKEVMIINNGLYHYHF